MSIIRQTSESELEALAIETASDASRRDTTLAAVRYVLQLPLVAQPGARGWVHRAMRLRVVESRPDRDVAA